MKLNSTDLLASMSEPRVFLKLVISACSAEYAYTLAVGVSHG